MKTLLLSLTVMTLLCNLASAQILDSTERRSNETTNQPIDRKVDEKIDKVENLGHGTDKSEDSYRVANTYNVPDAYVFQHSVDISHYAYDTQGNVTDESNITLFFSDNENLTGQKIVFGGRKMFFIFDHDQSRKITMVEMEGDYFGQVEGIKQRDYYDDESENSAPDMLYTPTGETKEISGYLCAAYKFEDVTIWMTDAAKINLKNFYAALYQGERGYTGMPTDYPDGTMIMREIERGMGETYVTLVEINMNSTEKVSTEGYTFIDMDDY